MSQVADGRLSPLCLGSVSPGSQHSRKTFKPEPANQKLDEINKKLAEVRKRLSHRSESPSSPLKRAAHEAQEAQRARSRRKRKHTLHHPKLDFVLGEVMFSPYMTRPLDRYPQETFEVPKRLQELKRKAAETSEVSKEELPYDAELIKDRFMREVANFSVSFNVATEGKSPTSSTARSSLFSRQNSIEGSLLTDESIVSNTTGPSGQVPAGQLRPVKSGRRTPSANRLRSNSYQHQPTSSSDPSLAPTEPATPSKPPAKKPSNLHSHSTSPRHHGRLPGLAVDNRTQSPQVNGANKHNGKHQHGEQRKQLHHAQPPPHQHQHQPHQQQQQQQQQQQHHQQTQPTHGGLAANTKRNNVPKAKPVPKSGAGGHQAPHSGASTFPTGSGAESKLDEPPQAVEEPTQCQLSSSDLEMLLTSFAMMSHLMR